MKEVKIPTMGEGQKRVRLDDGFTVMLTKESENRLGVNLPSIDPAITKYVEMPVIGMERAVIIKNVAVGITRLGMHKIKIRAWRIVQ